VRYGFVLLLVIAAGCSQGKTTEQLIAEDIKARGLDKAPPKLAPAPAASEFKPYSSPNGLFRVNFPGEPRAKDLGESKPMNRLAMESYVVVLAPRQYSVLCSHYAEPREPAKELQDLINLHISNTLEGKLVDSKEFTYKGRPGKEIVIVDDDKARRAKLIVDGKDVYQISVDLPKDEIDGEAAKAFVGSFEMLKD
jgi:hypothetical protein